MEYENQNVNTINIPKNMKEKLDYEINKINTSSNHSNTHTNVFYKLQIKVGDDSIISQEFDQIVKQIIENGDQSFLRGGVNLIEYLILKYSRTYSTGDRIQPSEVEKIESLTLRVKEEFSMLNEFGKYLTNLKELNLSGSGIISVSEIGTSFVNLITLNISKCSVNDLNGTFLFKIGIVCFTNLRDFDCSCNYIKDLLELQMCQSLKKIHLQNNEIEDPDNLTFLYDINSLEYINLSGNPILLNENYSKWVNKFLSHVKTII